jgi:hypothetical protein
MRIREEENKNEKIIVHKKEPYFLSTINFFPQFLIPSSVTINQQCFVNYVHSEVLQDIRGI